jgi:hypothetical protein
VAPPQATADFYRAQQRRIVATLGMVRREWAGMGSDFDSSWATVGGRVVVLTSAAQLGAARDGSAYVEALVGATQTAEVVPSALVGVASDGRRLASLLDSAVFEAKRGVAAGDSVGDALARGGRHLDMVVHTQVADAGRDATSLGVTARPRVRWVRFVNPPCCQRCAVLAGHVYSYATTFRRHPRCDCGSLPVTVANPDAAGIQIGPDDVKDLTQLQRKAIADGADFNKVINDYNRKGAWHLPPTRVDSITARAKSRADAVQQLTQAGYLAA